jgi:hypothetical protein
MESHVPAPEVKMLPIERIFQKVVGRKMTEPERLHFHLKPTVKVVRKIR